ncbi:MAG: hypothetical protein ACI9LY_003406 [Arenicella sp.]|jgi:hypothetical protein
MSRQLELDINRPSWADTDFRSEVKSLWSVREDNSPAQSKNKPVLDDLESMMTTNSERQAATKEL